MEEEKELALGDLLNQLQRSSPKETSRFDSSSDPIESEDEGILENDNWNRQIQNSVPNKKKNSSVTSLSFSATPPDPNTISTSRVGHANTTTSTVGHESTTTSAVGHANTTTSTVGHESTTTSAVGHVNTTTSTSSVFSSHLEENPRSEPSAVSDPDPVAAPGWYDFENSPGVYDLMYNPKFHVDSAIPKPDGLPMCLDGLMSPPADESDVEGAENCTICMCSWRGEWYQLRKCGHLCHKLCLDNSSAIKYVSGEVYVPPEFTNAPYPDWAKFAKAKGIEIALFAPCPQCQDGDVYLSCKKDNLLNYDDTDEGDLYYRYDGVTVFDGPLMSKDVKYPKKKLKSY